MLRSLIVFLATSAALMSQITGIPGSGGAPDSAVYLTRATDQAGTDKYCASTTGNATYTCSVTPALTAYTTGMCVVLNADFANVTTATVNINSLGAKSILNRTGAALAAGDITAGKPKTICYDGTQFIIQGDGGGATVSFPYVVTGGLYYGALTGPLTPVVDADFSWINQGAATVTDSNGSIVLWGPATGGVNLRVREMTAPATPYTLTAVVITNNPYVSFIRTGIGFREAGTGKIRTLGHHVTGPNYIVEGWNSATSYAAAVGTAIGTYNHASPMYFQIANDGTNLTYKVSYNGGLNYLQLHTELNTAFFTTAPDRLIFWVDTNQATWGAQLTVLSWKIT